MVPFDRSGRVRWMLEELAVPYEDRVLSWAERDLDSPEYRAISPLGRVPALVSGEVKLCETTVILDWIGRTHGTGSWSPDNQDDSAYRSWMGMAGSTIDAICFEFVRPDVPIDHREARRDQAAHTFQRTVLPALRQVLQSRDTVLEGGLCAVDLQIAASLHYADQRAALDGEPRLQAWLQQMRARPAAVQAGLFG